MWPNVSLPHSKGSISSFAQYTLSHVMQSINNHFRARHTLFQGIQLDSKPEYLYSGFCVHSKFKRSHEIVWRIQFSSLCWCPSYWNWKLGTNKINHFQIVFMICESWDVFEMHVLKFIIWGNLISFLNVVLHPLEGIYNNSVTWDIK